VRAGNFVFCSAFTASDFKNGIAVGRRAGFPNYGSDAEDARSRFMSPVSSPAPCCGRDIARSYNVSHVMIGRLQGATLRPFEDAAVVL